MRGYDPTSSDLSALAWNHLFEKWQGKKYLDIKEAHQTVQYWLQNAKYTSYLYQKFSQCDVKPTIRLRKRCDFEHQNFPTMTEGNELIICMNGITNKVQLKEHLDRQLTILHRQTIREGPTQDRQLMKDLLQGCRMGYKNYLLDAKVTQQLVVTCAKYLFFRKTRSSLPMDRKFRYTSKIAEQALEGKTSQ